MTERRNLPRRSTHQRVALFDLLADDLDTETLPAGTVLEPAA